MKIRGAATLFSLMAAIVLFAGQAMAEPITIEWWHAMRGARGETLDKMVKAFNDSQQQYKVVAVNKGDYGEVVNAGVAAYRAKKHPHILQAFEVGTMTMMRSGAIYPVYKLMADEGYKIDWSGYLQAVLSYYVDEKDNLLSMPFNSSTAVMYYNVDLFKKAGLEMPSKTTPLTWDQMDEITKKLVAAGAKKGMVTTWQSWIQIENYSAIHDLPFATKANGYEGLDTEMAINNPKVIKHLERLKSWMADNRFSYEGREYQGANSTFVAGDAAILMESVSGIGNVQKNAKFAWDIAPLPVEADMKQPQNSIIGGASLWVMQGHAKEEYKGVAAFLNFLAQPDMQKLWHKETGYFPITLKAYEELKQEGFFDKIPYQEVGIKQLNRTKPTKNSRGIRLGYFVQIRNILDEEMELIWNGKKTPAQAIADATARSNEKLREFEKTNK
jgi:sn-glycerol 3-phosphate transport system substrate-binding protein